MIIYNHKFIWIEYEVRIRDSRWLFEEGEV